jgi:peroxiredoxin
MQRQTRLIVLLAGSAIFLFALLGASYWLVHSLTQRSQTLVVETPTKPAPPPVSAAAPDNAALRKMRRTNGPDFLGKVVDLKTGRPIQRFTVTIGIYHDTNGSITYAENTAQSFRDGQYDYQSPFLSVFGAFDGFVVRVDADGHYSQASPALLNTGRQDFSLEPGDDLHGRVLAAEGTPVDNATVLIADADMSVQFGNGQAPLNRVQYHTNAEGRFNVPPQRGDFVVAAASDQGYATADQDQFAHSGDLRLTPWGRIHGTLLVHGKPAANEQITGEEPQSSLMFGLPRVDFAVSAKTDATGHFQIDCAPASDLVIGHLVSGQAWGAIHAMRQEPLQTVTVSAGQTLNVTVQNSRRTVVGRFLVPKELGGPGNWRVQGQLSTKTTLPPAPAPDEIKYGSPQAQQKWWNDFLNSPAGPPYRAALASRHVYTLRVDRDGTFGANGVQPGEYQIDGFIPSASARWRKVAVGQADLTVPQGGADDSPVKVPDVVMTYYPPVVRGSVAPSFLATTIEGKKLDLNDYRGKYVLLIIWTANFGEDNMTPLKQVFAAMEANPHVATIGLRVDSNAESTRRYVQANGLNWTQCFLDGLESENRVSLEYGTPVFPLVVLIGPDGKVIARDLKGAKIKSTVMAALST